MSKPHQLTILHASLQYSDTRTQRAEDAETVMSQGADLITGTEAGPGSGNTPEELKRQAKKHGYWFFLPAAPTDCWVAASKELMPKKPATGWEKVLEGSHAMGDPHRYGPKGIVWLRGETELGRISLGAFHGLTKARFHGMERRHKPGDPVDHRAQNMKLGRALGRWATREGKGQALAFVGGDSNLNDKKDDVFFGGPLTTCWDELKSWPNTGHGCIDVIASYDKDGRVSCKRARSFNDRQLHLHTDHFLIRATYEVRPLPTRS